MAIFKKKEDELGVQPAQTVADASADAAAQAQADAAKQAEEAARRAEEEARAKAEAANRKAQEQGLSRTIAEHSKGVGYKVVKYGEYVGKPGQNPAIAEQINKSNKAGEIKHGQSTFGVTNQIVVDYSTIKDVKQAAYFGLAVPEADREKYIKQYAKATNQDAKSVLAQFETITGDRYFAAPKSDGGKIRAANKALSGYGLLDYNGNTLDIYKSTPQQVIQSLHMDPDDDKHKDAFEAIKILQKTPGSAWYGMDLKLADLEFWDDAELTRSKYNEAVDDFNTAFTMSGEPTEANVEKYKVLVAQINAGRYGKGPRAQKYIMDALNKSFAERNGGYLPEAGAVAQSVADAEQSGAIQIETDPVSGEVTGAHIPSEYADSVTNPPFVFDLQRENGAKDVVAKINEETDKSGKDVMGGLATVGEDGKVVLHGTFGDEEIGTTSKRSAGGGGSPALTGGTVTVNGQEVQMSVPLASAGTMHGLTRNQLFPGAIQMPGMEGFGNPLGVDLNKGDKPEVQGPVWIPPVYRNAADVIANADRQTTEVNEVVPYDPDMTDARAMALYYSGRELDARNKAQIAAVADDRQSMDMLDAIYNANATTNGVASQRYPKYGNFIGWAMDSLSMGELDAESVNNGFFILNDVRKQINSMIENEGSIIVPYGVNQYDYILSRQPALMEKVEFVRGLPDEFRAAKTQAKTDEAKERQAIIDEYKAAMQRGDGTPDMAALLALEDMGGTDPGMDWMDDPTYNELLRETTRGGRLFASKGAFGFGAGSGEFWDGESLAAKAARSLNDKDVSLELKTYVNADTQDLLALMCQDAYQNNTTLDKWLESAGITGMDQLAELAFKNGVRTGNMLKNNPQVTEALDTIDISFGNSVSLGWNLAMTQSEAGTAETTQLLLDKMLHEGNRIEFRDKMWDAYGNQAPTVTRRKLYALLNGTDLSEESKEELKARLERSGDIFSVAADYIDLDGLQAWLHTKTNDKQKEAEDLMLIGSFLGGWDRRFFMAANMFGGTVAFAAKSTMGTVITGNPLAGAMIAGYGGIGDNYERYIDKGATEGEAWFMALSHWLVESKLNSGGNQSALDDMLAGENYIDDLFHALKNGKRNGFTTVMTAAKYMGGHALKRYAQEGGEGASEVLADTALEMLFDVYDQENEALKNGEGMSVSRLFETMLGTIEAVDPYEFGKEMLENFNAEGVMGFFMGTGGSLRLTGAAFADYRSLKQYKSVQMMQQLYEGDIPGTEENIGLICQQMALDLRDPNYRKWLDGQSKARRDLKNFGVAAAEGVGIEERGAAAELAAQAKELGEKRDAAQTAMEEAEAYCTELEDQVSAGNIALKPDMDAARTAQTRAAQAYNELMDAARKKGAQAEEAAKKWMDIMLAATENIGAEDLNHAIGRWTAQTFDMARALYEGQMAKMNAEEHEAWVSETFDMARAQQEEEQAMLAEAENEEWLQETFDMAHAQQEEEAELEAQVDAEAEVKAQEEAIAAEEEAVAQMTDEEIDAEIAAITENESRMTEADAQSSEMGYDEETLAALKEQTDAEAEAKAARKEAILRNQRNQYKSLTDRAEQAVQLGDEEAQAELLKQRQAVQARIEALGGKIEDPAENAPEPTTDVRPAMPRAAIDAKAQAQTGGENAPEPSTQSTPAKPVQKADPRREARIERATDIATGTTKEQRDAAKAEKRNADNISAMDVETFIEQRHKDAPEKEKATIRGLLNGFVNRTPAKITSDIYQFAARIEQKFGVKFEFVDSLDGKKRGKIEGSNIKIARDATPGELIRQTILHELTHKAEGAGKLYNALHDMILDMKYGGDQDQMNEDIKSKKRTYTDLYKKEGRTFTDTDAKQEIVADYMGEILDGNQAMIERLVRDDSTLAKRIMNTIKDAISKFAGVKDPQIKQMQRVVKLFEQALKKSDKAQGGTKYQVNPDIWYDYSNSFEKQAKDWKDGKISKSNMTILGGTPKVLRDIGFSNLPLVYDYSHMVAAFGEPNTETEAKSVDHKLSESFLEELPYLLENPIAVIENRNGKTDPGSQKRLGSSVIVIFKKQNPFSGDNADRRDGGIPYIGAFSITGGSRLNDLVIDANRVNTIHSPGNLKDYVKRAVQTEKSGGFGVYYLNKKALAEIKGGQLHELETLDIEGLNHSILDANSPVNGKQIHQTETRQFKHWFDGSRIKNEDGTPKVMYRGGNEDIDIFDRKKSSYSNLYGRGFYFTESKEQAGAYGDVYSYYLSVKHPLSATSGTRSIRQDQLRAFLEAVAEDEDYGLENYGYGATVDSVMRILKGKSDFDVLQDINATCIGDFVAAVELFNRVNDTRYDGIVTPTETVVFDSTQIKSATDNIGLFDPKNPNTKYSLPPQSSLEAEFRAWMQAHQAEMDEARKAYDGESQFAAKTIQNAKHTPEQVKKAFRENRYLNGYKKDTNADQFNRAMENIDRNGYDAEVDRLLNAETFSAEDTVEAGAIVKAAFEEEDVATALEMALKYETIGSEQAQAMQSRKLFADMSPSHVAMRVAGDVESKLMKVMDDNPDKAKKVNSRAKKKEDALKTLDSNDKLKELNKQSSFTVSDMLDEHDRKYGVITNEQQRAAIKEYGLENVKRPGIHYNRATQKQRMLEFILMTPDLTADTGNGLTGIQRLEWMKEGVPVITAADIRYIVDRIKEYCKMTDDDKGTRLGDIALGRAFEAFRNCSPATFAERNRAYRYVNMLLTLTSPGRNFIGNLGQVTVNDLSDETAGAFVDWIVSGKTGKRTQAHISLERRINAWHEFVAEIGNTFRDYFIDKVDTSLSMQGDNRMESTQRGRTFQNEAGNLLHNFEGFLMSFGDRTFYKREYFRSLAEQKQLADAKGVELDWEAAVDQAKADAEYATFNEDNAVRDVFRYIRRKHPVADFIASLYLPFVGIPSNMVKRGFIDYTPAGAFIALVKGARDVKAGKFNQREFVQAMSRGGITGSLLVGLGVLARATGFYSPGTSEDDDEKLYNLRAAQGHQYSPYIRLGEKYYNLSLIAPLIYPITIGATAYDILTDEDAEVLPSLYQAGIAAVNQLYDASFLSGIGDLFNTQDGNIVENAIPQAITNLIIQNIPLGAFLNQMGDLFDDYARDTKDANPFKESMKKVIARIPGAREYLLNPKYDITGEPVRGRDGVYDNLANPLSTTKANDDPVLMELSRLAQSTGSTAHIPSYLIKKSGKITINKDIADEWNVDMDRSAGENKLVLDADERSRYNQLYSSLAFNGTGDTYYEGVGGMETSFAGIRETMESWEYQNASDDGKAKLISDVLSRAKLLTQAQIVIDKGYATTY